MNKLKVVGAVAIGLALVSGASILHDAMEKPVVVEKLVPVEKTVEVVKEVRVDVPVEVVKEVEVVKTVTVEDESFLKMMCDRAMYDDLMECKEEITAEDKALSLAVSQIKEDFASELEDADIIAKEKYASLVKVYSNYEDVTVEDSDFDNEEYTFVVKAKINDNHEEAKSYVNFTVDVKDGEAEIVDVEVV